MLLARTIVSSYPPRCQIGQCPKGTDVRLIMAIVSVLGHHCPSAPILLPPPACDHHYVSVTETSLVNLRYNLCAFPESIVVHPDH